MEKSYNYIKHFIDTQVRDLNRPIELSQDMKHVLAEENINIKQFQIILMRINMLIKRHNSNMFSSRVIHQLIGQMVKCESYKVDLVSERLETVSRVIRPLILPNIHRMNCNNVGDVREFQILVDELPEGKYLYSSGPSDTEGGTGGIAGFGVTGGSGVTEGQEDTETGANETVHESGSDSDGLVQDFEQRVIEHTPQHLRSQFNNSINKQVKAQSSIDTALITQYETSRVNLLKINKNLQYKYKKLHYLKQLRKRLSGGLGLETKEDGTVVGGTVDNQIFPEVDKFKILVNSIKFKMNERNRREVEEKLKGL